MLAEADAADAWRLRTGRMHPIWGNGTLMAAALRRAAAPEPPLHDRAYCAALSLTYAALADRAVDEA